MQIHRELLVIFSEIAGVMVLWSLAGVAIKAHAHGEAAVHIATDFNVRLRSWWWMAIILGAAMLAGRIAVIVLFGLISCLALREFLTIARLRPADHSATLASFIIATPVQYLLIASGLTTASVIFVPMFAAIAIPCLVWRSNDRIEISTRIHDLVFALMLCVAAISYVPAVFVLRIENDRAILLILFLIVVTQLSDVLQYTFGKLLGRRKIAARISPHKTIEGTIGGIAGATLVGASLWRMTPFTPVQTLGVALVIACAGFAGGLILSAIKRDRGIKDWGRIIPGHGGILDRVDSIWLSAPLLFYLVRAFA